MEKKKTNNPRLSITLSEGHFSKLSNYAELYNLVPAQAAAYLLQRQIDITDKYEYERRNLENKVEVSATKLFYDAAFGKIPESEVNFPQAANEQGISLEEAIIRFEVVKKAKEKEQPASFFEDCKEECECSS